MLVIRVCVETDGQRDVWKKIVENMGFTCESIPSKAHVALRGDPGSARVEANRDGKFYEGIGCFVFSEEGASDENREIIEEQASNSKLVLPEPWQAQFSEGDAVEYPSPITGEPPIRGTVFVVLPPGVSPCDELKRRKIRLYNSEWDMNLNPPGEWTTKPDISYLVLAHWFGKKKQSLWWPHTHRLQPAR